MAGIEPAFKNIPKNSSFFLIWRIEKLQVVALPKDSYGTFFTGDSYIVASAKEEGIPGTALKSKEVKGRLSTHIHFWLGNETSQDEAGVAAYKTVELDDFLLGSPVQHREVQGWESKRFQAYFKNGIRYLSGGVESGLNHVSPDTRNRLFHVKGKRKPLIRQLSEIAWSAMNDGDVYIIDANQIIYIWNGKYSNHMEKIQGAKVGQQMRSERGGAGIVFLDDGHEGKMTDDEMICFNEILPIKEKSSLQSHSKDISDELVERKQRTELKLYRCSDEGGTLKVTEVKCGPIDQSDLKSQDSFIVDNGESGIWVWVGKRASPKERLEAMRNAQGFIKKKGYSKRTQVTRVIDGGEPTEFKSLFRSWFETNRSTGINRQFSNNKIAKTIQTKFDASTLHENPKLAAQTQMVDAGNGTKEVFHVINFDLVPLEEKEHGKFFSGDCYVIVYAYSDGRKDHFLIYYWLGLHSSIDERGTAAIKTVELDNKLDGKAVQIRVMQGKEPAHFMAMFGGKMIIYQGGAKSGFNKGPDELGGPEGSYMLQVRGTSDYDTKAIQVDLRASSLNSNDTFLLVIKDGPTYVWAGKGSTGDEREMAKKIANTTGKEVVMVYEGQEKQDFWDDIGGIEPYASDKQLAEREGGGARLFQCSNASGRFVVEEIVDFEQSDLVEEDVMLLDAWHTLFLWIGLKSNADEQKMASVMAEEYLNTDPSGRNVNSPIVKVKQGHEVPSFTGYFGAWDTTLWKNKKSYDEIRLELANQNPGIFVYHSRRNGMGGAKVEEESAVDKYPLESLQVKDPALLPEGVDPTRKEIYLDDFEGVFGMTLEEFNLVPRWKQVNLKKGASIF